ncbi:hypothetical protein ACGFNU_33475 [Spirillospora sp. NPDC048911]|uniref:hypothetical protein n=1 Tax=Spirillospora sp. NPDC048911 TaxID=3364527 RepID=UPI0037247F8C
MAAVGGTTAIAATFLIARPAGAIPVAQAGCEFSSFTLSPASGFLPLTNLRRVSPTSETFLKAEVTADVGVSAGAEVRLGWSVNSGRVTESFFGPANFANHQEFFETRSTFAIMSVGAGNQTVQPFVRVVGPSSARATFVNRCSTVEGSTS